jgi:hypothetical protein
LLGVFLFATNVETPVEINLNKLTEEESENIREFLCAITAIFDEFLNKGDGSDTNSAINNEKQLSVVVREEL